MVSTKKSINSNGFPELESTNQGKNDSSKSSRNFLTGIDSVVEITMNLNNSDDIIKAGAKFVDQLPEDGKLEGQEEGIYEELEEKIKDAHYECHTLLEEKRLLNLGLAAKKEEFNTKFSDRKLEDDFDKTMTRQTYQEIRLREEIKSYQKDIDDINDKILRKKVEEFSCKYLKEKLLSKENQEIIIGMIPNLELYRMNNFNVPHLYQSIVIGICGISHEVSNILSISLREHQALSKDMIEAGNNMIRRAEKLMTYCDNINIEAALESDRIDATFVAMSQDYYSSALLLLYGINNSVKNYKMMTKGIDELLSDAGVEERDLSRLTDIINLSVRNGLEKAILDLVKSDVFSPNRERRNSPYIAELRKLFESPMILGPDTELPKDREKYKHRTNSKEGAIAFLNRVWGDLLREGRVYQFNLRKIDQSLIRAIDYAAKKEGRKLADYVPTKKVSIDLELEAAERIKALKTEKAEKSGRKKAAKLESTRLSGARHRRRDKD